MGLVGRKELSKLSLGCDADTSELDDAEAVALHYREHAVVLDPGEFVPVILPALPLVIFPWLRVLSVVLSWDSRVRELTPPGHFSLSPPSSGLFRGDQRSDDVVQMREE